MIITGEDGWTTYNPPIKPWGTLLAAGTLFKIRRGHGKKEQVVLVGDINELGGSCDCCCPHDGALVVASKRIWEPSP